MTQIRRATKDDVSVIWELTRELAEYEKALDSFLVTEDYFLEALFGPAPHAECYLIEDEGEVIGMGGVYITLNTYGGRYALNLQDFIIKEKFRGKGYGQQFLEYLAKLAHDRGYARIDWGVASWNEPSINFYNKSGAVTLQIINFRLTENQIRKIVKKL